jgi:hypothetical protein
MTPVNKTRATATSQAAHARPRWSPCVCNVNPPSNLRTFRPSDAVSAATVARNGPRPAGGEPTAIRPSLAIAARLPYSVGRFQTVPKSNPSPWTTAIRTKPGAVGAGSHRTNLSPRSVIAGAREMRRLTTDCWHIEPLTASLDGRKPTVNYEWGAWGETVARQAFFRSGTSC